MYWEKMTESGRGWLFNMSEGLERLVDSSKYMFPGILAGSFMRRTSAKRGKWFKNAMRISRDAKDKSIATRKAAKSV